MQCVAVVGVGLIGGSFGLALRKAGFTGDILGVSSDRTIAAAVERKAIDRGVSLAEAAAQADLIYLAQPISGILSRLDELAGLVRPDTLVTDAGSTKVEVVRRAEALPCAFIGGHPMAGKESRGVETADPDLFRDRTYVLTPRTGETRNSDLAQWLELIGSNVVELTPEEHDKLVALTSHLPQLASTALADLLSTLSSQSLAISGSGARDMTRLALSSFDIWGDILATNREAIDHALAVYIDKLTEMRDNLQTQQVSENFRVAAELATRLRHRSTLPTTGRPQVATKERG